MAPTLVTAYTVNSGGINNSTLSTPSFTPASNEFIVVTVTTYENTTTVSGVSATANSPSFTSRYSATPSSNGSLYMWTARITPAVPAAMVISATASGSTGYRQMIVSRWTTATVNPSPAIGSATSSSTGSGSVSTVGTNSVVVWAAVDWNGADTTSAAYRAGSALGTVYTSFGDYTGYSGYQTAAAAGAQTFGISGLTSPKFHMAGIELVTWTPAGGAFAGVGSLNPNPTAQAALTGTGNLTVINAAGPVTAYGRGKVVATATRTQPVQANLTGTGGLAIGGTHAWAAAVSWAGSSTLVASPTPVHLVSAELSGAGGLTIAGGLDFLTGPLLTTENVVGYFALRDLGLLTGDASYTTAAAAIKTSLLSNHWGNRTQRLLRGMGDAAESLLATALGGLFLTATGEYDRARHQARHLRRYRVKGAAIDGFHVDGPSGLQGYRPYGELESASFATPPTVIDQAGSWAALLFASRFGEPVGEDVRSLQRWRFNTDDSSYLYGAQWLRYSADAAGTTPVVRTRPYLGSAAWAYLLSQGAPGLFTADPVALPQVSTLALARGYDYGLRKLVLTATWTRDSAPCAAYELILESSTNGGSTWSRAQNTVRDSIERARVGASYRYVWKLRMPTNSATRYRVRLRLRNARFGTQVTSSSVTLPTI